MNAFATDGTPVLFRILQRVHAAQDVKELPALELMPATSVTAMPPITASFASYRSHAEGFLYSCGDPAAVRDAFDAHYNTRREALVDRTRAVLATLHGTADTAPLARQWADLCREYGHRVAPLIRRGVRRREFLNLLRFLGNELRIPLVGVGTRDAYLAIRSDDQLENRFAPFTLPRGEAGADACSLLASFAASFPLRRTSPIATTEMASYLLTWYEGSIDQRTLLATSYTGPTERRRLFERELA